MDPDEVLGEAWLWSQRYEKTLGPLTYAETLKQGLHTLTLLGFGDLRFAHRIDVMDSGAGPALYGLLSQVTALDDFKTLSDPELTSESELRDAHLLGESAIMVGFAFSQNPEYAMVSKKLVAAGNSLKLTAERAAEARGVDLKGNSAPGWVDPNAPSFLPWGLPKSGG